MRTYRLSAAAERDIVDSLTYTDEQFGELARRRYETLIVTALRDIAADPERNGSALRVELGPGVRIYHLRHSRDRARLADGVVRRPRHLVLYRPLGADLIGVSRLLHDAMDLQRHLPTEDDA